MSTLEKSNANGLLETLLADDLLPIIGLIVAGVLILIVCLCCCDCLRKRRKRLAAKSAEIRNAPAHTTAEAGLILS